MCVCVCCYYILWLCICVIHFDLLLSKHWHNVLNIFSLKCMTYLACVVFVCTFHSFEHIFFLSVKSRTQIFTFLHEFTIFFTWVQKFPCQRVEMVYINHCGISKPFWNDPQSEKSPKTSTLSNCLYYWREKNTRKIFHIHSPSNLNELLMFFCDVFRYIPLPWVNICGIEECERCRAS